MAAPLIQARYETLEDISVRFGRQSEQTSMLIQRLRRHVQALHNGGWVGHGADAFFQEMRLLWEGPFLQPALPLQRQGDWPHLLLPAQWLLVALR